MKKAIFLDRDGIINKAIIKNKKPYPPTKLSEVEPILEINNFIYSWKAKGYLIIIVTNQPDVSRGTLDKNIADQINEHLSYVINFDDIFVCYHGNDNECDCRKPKIGLFMQAKEKYDIDLSKSWMVGDRWRDVEAGKNAGCKTIFVDYGYDEKQPTNQDYTVRNVLQVYKIIGE